VIIAVLLALAVYLAVRYGPEGIRAAPRCTVVSGDGEGTAFRFSPGQAANAATIAVVGTSRGMPERAVTIALATALQESGLRNLDHGDRDSLGLFQQRPSQGWGTAGQIMDPVYAAGRFYEHLAKVPGYAQLPLTVAAQRVQQSNYPEAYAKHETDATLLAAALTGRAAATLTCEGGSGTGPGDPAKIRKALVHDFGGDVLAQSAASEPKGGAAAADAGAKDSPAASALASGGSRTVIVPVRVAGGSAAGATRQRGWELAHWAVANSSGLHIEQVGYAGRQWTASAGDKWSTTGSDDGKGKGGTAAPGPDQVLIVTAH
jgi:hypothetical protein